MAARGPDWGAEQVLQKTQYLSWNLGAGEEGAGGGPGGSKERDRSRQWPHLYNGHLSLEGEEGCGQHR